MYRSKSFLYHFLKTIFFYLFAGSWDKINSSNEHLLCRIDVKLLLDSCPWSNQRCSLRRFSRINHKWDQFGVVLESGIHGVMLYEPNRVLRVLAVNLFSFYLSGVNKLLQFDSKIKKKVGVHGLRTKKNKIVSESAFDSPSHAIEETFESVESTAARSLSISKLFPL